MSIHPTELTFDSIEDFESKNADAIPFLVMRDSQTKETEYVWYFTNRGIKKIWKDRNLYLLSFNEVSETDIINNYLFFWKNSQRKLYEFRFLL